MREDRLEDLRHQARHVGDPWERESYDGLLMEWAVAEIEALRSALASPVIRDALAERRRQVEVEGWTPEHDDTHDKGELAQAAACYLTGRVDLWPWSGEPKLGNARSNFARAFALFVAEGERRYRTLPAEGCDSVAAASSSEDPGINSSEVGR